MTSRLVARLSLLALLALSAPALVPSARAQQPAPVAVDGVRPHRERHATLRFLRSNRDFIRARIDRLRERPLARREDAQAIDPRLLAYAELLAQVEAATDSVRVSDDARARRTLLASVTQLGDLEAQLDQLERVLADQRGRLAALERDFAGDQRTALMVVLSGCPAGAEVDTFALTLEDGTRITAALTDAQRAALRQGGVVEVFHGLVEPRVQAFELALAGGAWTAGGPGFVTLDPARDRLTVLRLDLAPVTPRSGAAAIHATTWQHAAGIAAIDG